jgi:hypothetical protein
MKMEAYLSAIIVISTEVKGVNNKTQEARAQVHKSSKGK